MKLVLSAAVLALVAGVFVLRASVVLAQAPPPDALPVRVTTNAPLPLLVNGLDTEKLPAAVALGSEVCVAAVQHYETEVERWLFQRWAHGPTTECVTLTEAGNYRALYRREVLFRIRSSVSQLQKDAWVPQGIPVDVQVPESVLEGERTRYRFLQWSEGETPILPANRIAPLKPMTLEAKFAKEYLVRVERPALSGAEGVQGAELPGSGWYAEGASLVLRAPDVLPGQAATDRLKFTRWETVGSPSLLIPDAAKPTITVKVDAPYTLRAVYETEYRFSARNPTGILGQDWVKAGEDIEVETPPVVEISPERERLVFRRWEGLEGVTAPKVSGVILASVEMRAVYERQVMVTLDAPYGGSGGGWQTPGTTVTVSAPGSAQSKLVFIRRFEGFAGYASGKSSIQVLVTEPITITAIYSSEVDLRVLGLLVAPLWLALLYVVSRWVLRLAPRRRSMD